MREPWFQEKGEQGINGLRSKTKRRQHVKVNICLWNLSVLVATLHRCFRCLIVQLIWLHPSMRTSQQASVLKTVWPEPVSLQCNWSWTMKWFQVLQCKHIQHGESNHVGLIYPAMSWWAGPHRATGFKGLRGVCWERRDRRVLTITSAWLEHKASSEISN